MAGDRLRVPRHRHRCGDRRRSRGTGGAGNAGIATPRGWTHHDGELQFWFVLSGEASLLRPDHPAERLAPGDAVAVPPGMTHSVATDDAGCEFLEVTVPAAPV